PPDDLPHDGRNFVLAYLVADERSQIGEGGAVLHRADAHEDLPESLVVDAEVAFFDLVSETLAKFGRRLHGRRDLRRHGVAAWGAGRKGEAELARLALGEPGVSVLGRRNGVGISWRTAVDRIEIGGGVAHAAADAEEHRRAVPEVAVLRSLR